MEKYSFFQKKKRKRKTNNDIVTLPPLALISQFLKIPKQKTLVSSHKFESWFHAADKGQVGYHFTRSHFLFFMLLVSIALKYSVCSVSFTYFSKWIGVE